MDPKKLERVLAQKAHVDISLINKTSLPGVSLTLAQLQQDIVSLFDLVSEQKEEIDSLNAKLENYESHQHDYDNNGTPSTTQGVK